MSQKEEKQIQVKMPKMIQEYYSYVGGFDLLDKQF
jgi:hypothetical protein